MRRPSRRSASCPKWTYGDASRTTASQRKPTSQRHKLMSASDPQQLDVTQNSLPETRGSAGLHAAGSSRCKTARRSAERASVKARMGARNSEGHRPFHQIVYRAWAPWWKCSAMQRAKRDRLRQPTRSDPLQVPGSGRRSIVRGAGSPCASARSFQPTSCRTAFEPQAKGCRLAPFRSRRSWRARSGARVPPGLAGPLIGALQRTKPVATTVILIAGRGVHFTKPAGRRRRNTQNETLEFK